MQYEISFTTWFSFGTSITKSVQMKCGEKEKEWNEEKRKKYKHKIQRRFFMCVNGMQFYKNLSIRCQHSLFVSSNIRYSVCDLIAFLIILVRLKFSPNHIFASVNVKHRKHLDSNIDQCFVSMTFLPLLRYLSIEFE